MITDKAICDLRQSQLKGISAKTLAGWLYPKNSMLKRIADNFMLLLSEEGIEKKIYDEHYGHFDFIKEQCEVEAAFIPVGFDIVLILFKILGCGSGIAVLLAMLEWIKQRLVH